MNQNQILYVETIVAIFIVSGSIYCLMIIAKSS